MDEAKASALKAIKQRIYEIIEKPKEGDRASAVFNSFLVILICLNIVAVIATSVDGIYAQYSKLFNYFEYFSITIFTIEYLLRIWTAPKKWKYISSPLAVIDIVAILPFYLTFIFGAYGFSNDLRILRILRLSRLLRVLKLDRYNSTLQRLSNVFKNEKDKLLMTIFFMFILIILASSMMYFIENEYQPEQFPNIPATLWWAIATLTTVGYGDVYPITVLGKILGGIISVFGIGLVALPSGIIAGGLMQEAITPSADPENIYSVFNRLEKYLVYIKAAVKDACEELNKKGFAFNIYGNQQRNISGYGVYFGDTENKSDDMFFGVSPQLCNEINGKNFVYSLAIQRKAINDNLALIDKVKYPYLSPGDEWVYIQINRNIFEGETPIDTLRDSIVDIVENVYLKNNEKNTLSVGQ
jgi:voltage-gated potassium channel